ncbi:helix-turn-helix domain-containing protein [Amycolatopsis cihanbeyliensis]|uniref:PucR-like helix-turn-helix protein n=1 Tax=Amycolatopsis cihanbeyliensis TaxID=1128664 RepID=A0A542DJ49_AMYCI|nr:helix-turn-helix domain-containing protein [Amycolatopsis cihanbeyliensis]TQJ02995.1 PucR-like helix-turn-helix protein [Amycolatopsis cihanbeyliensis]
MTTSVSGMRDDERASFQLGNIHGSGLFSGQPGVLDLAPRAGEQAPAAGRTRTAAELWGRVPRAFAQEFRPYTDRLAEDIKREVQSCVPAYARPLDGRFGGMFLRAVHTAIEHCLRSVGTAGGGGAVDPGSTEVFRELGRLEFVLGHGVDNLQSAYRIGGRVAWRHVAGFCRAAGISADLLCVAAEAIFAFVDELSAMSIDGYTAARAEHAGALEHQRQRLIRLILAEPATPAAAITEAAAGARWPVPDTVHAVALQPRESGRPAPDPALPGDVLARLDGAGPCLVTADPERHLAEAGTELAGWRVAVGPPVRLTGARDSLRLARRTLDLADRGLLPDAPVLWSREHLATLWLTIDAGLIDAQLERCLAPLRAVGRKQRTRLAATLLAWLSSRANAPELAERLGVHPQTVRSRLHQIEELFGDRINDPAERFNLLIALRAQRLRSGADAPGSA